MKTITTFFLLLLVVQAILFAQTPEESTSDFSYFLGDISYSNDAVFMGRRDSIRAPYVYSSLGYYDRTGFFGNASASYLVSSEEQRIDLFLISAGYLFTGETLSAGLSGTKYFFNEESYNVQSEIEADITAMVNYDFKLAELSLSAAVYFGSSSPDLVASFMLDRTFYALDRKLLIMPAVIVGAGTQYFYEEYYNTSRLGNRKSGGNGHQGPGGSGITQSEMTNVTISEASEFNILNIEARLPLQYYHKSFIFSFTPMMAFPQSSASITTESAVYKEDLDSVFYWSAGISYWIKTGK